MSARKKQGQRSTAKNKIDLCKNCGEEFSRFLHEMQEHNEKVVCPSCGTPRKTKDPAKPGGRKAPAPNP